MAAYVITTIEEITDPTLFEEYRRSVRASIDAFGGRFLVRGAQTSMLEGDDTAALTTIVQFPDMKCLRAWYESDAYAPLRDIREGAAKAKMLAVEGV
jgi:uncharacterized protein (DUF1330 family)